MGRKHELEKSAFKYLNRIRSGSAHTKKTRVCVMMQLIDDLAKTKQHLPDSISKIQSSQISLLVKFWREKGFKEKTILNRLGVLRTINNLTQLNIDIPSNTALGLRNESTVRKIMTTDFSILDKVSHPITRSVLAFQLHFGLTQSEAIQIDPDLISHAHALMVMRSIAHNKRDRNIPILNAEQETVINERRILSDKKITEIMPIKMVNHLIKFELMFLGFNESKDLRAIYAKKRFSEVSANIGEQQAIKKLMIEIGIKKSKPIYALLNS